MNHLIITIMDKEKIVILRKLMKKMKVVNKFNHKKKDKSNKRWKSHKNSSS